MLEQDLIIEASSYIFWTLEFSASKTDTISFAVYGVHNFGRSGDRVIANGFTDMEKTAKAAKVFADATPPTNVTPQTDKIHHSFIHSFISPFRHLTGDVVKRYVVGG